MKHKAILYVLLATLFILTACGASVQPEPTPAPPPTKAPEPTPIPPTEPPPEPTLPNLPPPSNLPPRLKIKSSAMISRANCSPAGPGKMKTRTAGQSPRTAGLQIMGEDPSLLGGEAQSNLLWRDLPGGDFSITVHLKTQPLVNFQQATIYLYEDVENFVALNRGYCDICLEGGNAYYFEFKIGGEWGTYNHPTDATDVYLRLTREGDVISGYYAEEPGQWERIGRYGGSYFEFKRVGIGVTNADPHDVQGDLVGQFDYFEITRP